jgi:OOP family OmpA-OmpF porin
MFKIERLLWTGWLAVMTACASAPIPYKTPVSVTPPSGRVAVSRAVNLFDVSGSQELVFADGKATLEALVAAMPNGNYQTGTIAFGGFKREATGIARFDRTTLATAAKNTTFLEGTTPIYSLLEVEVAEAIGNGSGKAAIVLISDGIATDYAGHSGVDEQTIAAARAVVEGRSGETCFHAIQLGDDPAGGELLRGISGVTPCGSFRSASSLGTASALQAFSRAAYLGGAMPRAAAVVTASDMDGDGVADALDACPDTPGRARVDSRGCWTIKHLQFAVNGSTIEGNYNAGLQEAIAVLAANPSVRIRIDGHTDSDGSAELNQKLSEKRAMAVRDYFVVKGGLATSRFEVKGLGETKPIAPNDSSANKRLNRRVELTVLE